MQSYGIKVKEKAQGIPIGRMLMALMIKFIKVSMKNGLISVIKNKIILKLELLKNYLIEKLSILIKLNICLKNKVIKSAKKNQLNIKS